MAATCTRPVPLGWTLGAALLLGACLADNPAFTRSAAPDAGDVSSPADARPPDPQDGSTLAGDGPPEAASDVMVAPDAGPAGPLVGWWKLDDGPTPNMAALDSSGLANDGTVEGLGGQPWVPGKHGMALSFPAGGRVGGVQIPLSPSLRSLRQITVAAWINVEPWASAVEQQPSIASQHDDEGLTGETFNLQVYDAADLQGYIQTGTAAQGTGTGPAGVRATGVVVRGEWTHVAMTYDGSTLVLYRNGAEVRRGSISRPFVPGGKPFYLGVNKNGPTDVQQFEGLLDDVVIYSAALPPAAISALAGGADPRTLPAP